MGKRWDRARVAWAATGTVAAHVIAPYLTWVSSGDVYVGADTIAGLEAAATRVDLRPIEGGRLTLRPFPTVTARSLADVKEGLRVAPWPRVYADLRGVGVRGEEAAEHLREVFVPDEDLRSRAAREAAEEPVRRFRCGVERRAGAPARRALADPSGGEAWDRWRRA